MKIEYELFRVFGLFFPLNTTPIPQTWNFDFGLLKNPKALRSLIGSPSKWHVGPVRPIGPIVSMSAKLTNIMQVIFFFRIQHIILYLTDNIHLIQFFYFSYIYIQFSTICFTVRASCSALQWRTKWRNGWIPIHWHFVSILSTKNMTFIIRTDI